MFNFFNCGIMKVYIYSFFNFYKLTTKSMKILKIGIAFFEKNDDFARDKNNIYHKNKKMIFISGLTFFENMI